VGQHEAAAKPEVPHKRRPPMSIVFALFSMLAMAFGGGLIGTQIPVPAAQRKTPVALGGMGLLVVGMAMQALSFATS
jgi:hypothetical protein